MVRDYVGAGTLMADPASSLPPGFKIDPIASLPAGFKVDSAPTVPAKQPDALVQGVKDVAAGKGLWGSSPQRVSFAGPPTSALRALTGIAGPMAAAQFIPGVPELEGIGLAGMAGRSLAMGLGGGVTELANQGLERIRGERKEMDWGSVARSAGLNAAWEAGAIGAGSLVKYIFGAGKLASEAPKLAARTAAGLPTTSKMLRESAQKTTQAESEAAFKEAQARTALDTLGHRLGMSAEQSDKLTEAWNEGRQVGDAFYVADRQVAHEFNADYDAVLKGHENSAVPGIPIASGIADKVNWLGRDKNLMGQVRPSLLKRVVNIAKQAGAADLPQMERMTVDDVMEYRRMNGLPALSKQEAEQWIAQMEDSPVEPVTVTQARGWQSELRAIDRSQNLTEPEKVLVRGGESALGNSIKATLPRDAAAALDEVDKRYGVFKSSFRTFWKALKDKKSLTEVGDAMFNQVGKNPDRLRYVLRAADRAGRMDDMRMAFVNKLWRESQGAGESAPRIERLKKYYDANFAPGAKGNDILHMVMGKQPGISENMHQFTKNLEYMGRAQEAMKSSGWPARMARSVQFRILIGSLAGGGLTYGAFQKDPATALGVGMSILAGLEGLNWITHHPGLQEGWARWISTNPNSELFIKRGSELAGLFLAEQQKDQPRTPPRP